MKGLTMRTELVPLSLEQANGLARWHNDSVDNEEDGDIEIVVDVMTAVKDAINDVGGTAFVKLSIRSPKGMIYEEPN